MRKSLLRQVTLYKYRYTGGIAIFALLLIGLLLIRLDLAPTGYTSAEMSSAVTSATMRLSDPFTQSLVNAPYHVLQKLSLSLLGLNELGLLLPSIVLGFATGVAFVVMVRRWFKMNVAIITSFIFVTSAAFLSLARTGTPEIMTTFWLSVILLAVTNILHPEGKSRLWGVVLLLSIPLSLYTPLMIYPLIAIGVAGLLHPHVRFAARKLTTSQYLLSALLIIVLLAPLAISSWHNPGTPRLLLGIPDPFPSSQILVSNLQAVVTSFFSIGTTQVGYIPQPIFGVASLIIIVLGFIKTLVDRYSARSYMLLMWSLFFIPIAILNPADILICLVPSYLFMAIGIETLIREWYKLFPLNPYARLAGLLPLTILLGGIMFSNSTQYFYGYFYGTPKEQHREQLLATQKYISSIPSDQSITVVTLTKEAAFYDLLRRDYSNISIAISAPNRPQGNVIVHHGATYAPGAFGNPTKIITSYKTKADRVIAREFSLATD